MTLYDRYLLGRFGGIFAVCFVAFFGLFVVIDGFTNLDRFQHATEAANGTSTDLLLTLGAHYSLQLFVLFDMLGPTLVIISTMIVLAIGLKFGEIHPLFAAGIRGYRICLPLVVASLTVSLVLAANREFILPGIAHRLHGSHGSIALDERAAEPLYDSNGIFIAARALRPSDRSIRDASFRLPSPAMSIDYATVRAERASYIDESDAGPGGWHLQGLQTPITTLGLTERGEGIIIPSPNDPSEAYVVTQCSFEELSDRSTSFQYMATPRLIRRIRKTPVTDMLAHAQVVEFHNRLSSPFLGMIGVLIAAPLVVRKERWSLVGNLAMAMLVVGIVYGIAQGSHALGQANLMPADLSVWLPLVVGAGLAAWIAPEMRT